MDNVKSTISSPSVTTGCEVSRRPIPSSRTDHGAIQRSCLLCHRRKIRCNKRLPCSNCIRGNTQCQYPGPNCPARKPPKLTINQIDARVARLERIIASRDRPGPVPDLDKTAMDIGEGTDEEESDRGELLVEDGDSTHYVNDFLFSRIIDEVKMAALSWYSCCRCRVND